MKRLNRMQDLMFARYRARHVLDRGRSHDAAADAVRKSVGVMDQQLVIEKRRPGNAHWKK